MPCIDRRRFLRQMEVLAGGVMCGALPLLGNACAARARYVTPSLVGDRLGIPASSLSAAEGGAGGLLVEDPRSDLPIYVRRTSAGGYTAIGTRCGHRGCQVEAAAEKMVCPCHGSEYTFTGDILRGPTERPLTRYHVTADAEMVYVYIGRQVAP
jgi:nitrite reductase/ring-hydroxylating ferredoxin subunit